MTTILLGRICRTCLKKSTNMYKLRECIKDNLRIENMLNQIIPNYDMDMDDITLPVEICKDCLSKLQISFDFVQTCLQSNRELKNIFYQHELEIVSPPHDVKQDINNIEVLEETDMLMDNFKKEPLDNSSIESHVIANDMQVKCTDCKLEIVKLEDDVESESHYVDNSHSDEEYRPNYDKDDSNGEFIEKFVKTTFDLKPKRKYHRKVPLKRGSTKTCQHCKKIFAKKNLLTRHLAVHNSDNKFICEVCDYRFSTERNLKTHVSAKHTSAAINLDGGPYPCPDCPMIFQQTRALAAHSVMHSERDFKCQVCSLNLKTLAAVTRHMNSKHPDVLPHKCHLCEKSFPVEYRLNDHINEHMGFKKHKCDSCEKSFPNSTALRDHVRIHTGESPFLCPHCGKSFKTGNVLRQHLQRHGEKKFNCAECPMKFYTKVNLTKHMTSHTKVKPHVCEACGSAFTRQDSLKAHRFKHSGERPFKCQDCNMSFVFKRHLKRHKITHTGEKPHMCNFCDRAYAASGDLVKHLRTHVGEKTYFCDQCPESFKYSLDLKEHKNLHYKEKINSQKINAMPGQIPNSGTVKITTDGVVTLEETYEPEKISQQKLLNI